MSHFLSRDEGSVRVLTFARPPGNALTADTLRAFRAGLERARADPGVRAVLLESSVDGYFSSGMDLEEILSLPIERRAEPFEALLGAYRSLLNLPKPCVAALSGSAILGGWVIAMACDFRVMGSGAKIALSEIRAGLTPTPGLIARLSQLCANPRVVKEMVLRGRSLGAEEALMVGLADELAPEEGVKPAALALARKLAKSPRRAYAATKAALNASAGDETLWTRSLAEFSSIFAGDEAAEGLAAFRDKRRPRWENS